MSGEKMEIVMKALEMARDLADVGLCDFKKYGLTCDKDIVTKLSAAITALRETLSVIEQEEYHTKSIRYDLSPAMVEGVIRDKLIEMGWTPPSQTTQMTPDHVREGIAVPDAHEAKLKEQHMSKQKIWEFIEAYRTSGGRVEHHARKELLDAALDEALAEQPAIGDIRALKHRIHELEGDVIGYK